MEDCNWTQPYRGLWVAFYGMDGAGKTAVIDSLCRRISPCFRTIHRFHFRPRFRRRQRVAPTVTAPHAQPPRGALISMLKLCLWLADAWFGFFASVVPCRMRSGLTIYDRFLPDLLVDPRRYRLPQASLRFGEMLLRLAPRPHLSILLDASAEVVYQRKQEVELGELQRQREAYLVMFRSLPSGWVVDATGTVEEVSAEVKSLLLASLPECSYGTEVHVARL